MKAPKIQRTGKKIPKKNIHPCLFLSVINPSVKTKTKYKIPPPIPIPHHIRTSNRVASEHSSPPVWIRTPSRASPHGGEDCRRRGAARLRPPRLGLAHRYAAVL